MLNVLAFLLSAITACSATLCPYKECKCTNSAIDCRGAGLTSLTLSNDWTTQAAAGASSWTLDVSNNNISMIGDSDLPANLTVFTSMDTPLVSVSDHAFRMSANTLDMVHIRNSSLTAVPQAITKLKAVRTLVWTHHVMPRLPDLTAMTSLTYLGLWTNQIVSSTEDILPTGLDTLHLHDNNLTVLPQSLSDLDKLTLLEIGQNNIRSLNSAPLPSTLMYLGVSDNLISELSALTFTTDQPQIHTFNLSGNPLREMTDGALANLVKLQRLDVSDTRLRRLPASITTLPALQRITARHMSDLLCDCGDQPLGDWLYNNPSVTVEGDCAGSDLKTTLSYLSQFCPPVVG